MMRNLFLFVLITLVSSSLVVAQEVSPPDPEPLIEATPTEPTDAEISTRITEIFSQLEELSEVEITVEAGVVSLDGMTLTTDAASRAEQLAARVAGVVTVENNIEWDVSVVTRVTPAIGQLETFTNGAIKLLPLVALAIVVFLAIAAIGWFLSEWKALWRYLMPNSFIAELAATTIRAVFIVLAAVAALSLLDATALLGAFLGAAGVLGLAIGFAVRDTIENYISSIMLSLRQPFRPNDHVVIDDQQGHVIRLTSRATILMTPQGNHLRIPNSSVFKAVILNYSRNPERRFEFELGVDADDDPLAAIETGLEAINSLDFVLKEPAPLAYIKEVGDSNIVIFFASWIDQRAADFAKSRSIALSAAKDALEDAGFALPEPIYRLRFDSNNATSVLNNLGDATVRESGPETENTKPSKQRPKREHKTADVTPDTHLADKVEEERRESGADDLLNDSAPVE